MDRITWVGEWLERHGLPCQGVFVDMGHESDEADEGAFVEDDGPFAAVLPPRRFLLLRDGSQEPVDDMEFDYLTHLAHDFELIMDGALQQKSERRIAQTLQAGMRNDLGSVPGITADSLYSSATRQALVGGDFYTLIRLPDDRAVMILGDVSGKGVEAASMSALVKTALTAYAWEGASPARMARSLNRMVMSFSRVETFVTVFIAKLDLRHGRATYCSAGHPPTMLLRLDGAGQAEAELLSVQSGVVGAFSTMVYENGTFSFAPGDILFMYTDGAIEARDAGGDFLARSACARCCSAPPPVGWTACAGRSSMSSTASRVPRSTTISPWWPCALIERGGPTAPRCSARCGEDGGLAGSVRAGCRGGCPVPHRAAQSRVVHAGKTMGVAESGPGRFGHVVADDAGRAGAGVGQCRAANARRRRGVKART